MKVRVEVLILPEFDIRQDGSPNINLRGGFWRSPD